jgi:outer membrane biosynthesis protein TonB
MDTTSRGTTVICPKCGEDNADNFRFCGMCGAVLEKATPARAHTHKVERVRDDSIPVALTIPANPPRPRSEKRVEPISGPSVLGLGQPTLDSLREKAFSGSDPSFEVEEPKTGGRKLVLLLLLAALGAAGWWTYTNYIAIGEAQKQEAAVSNPATNQHQPPAEQPATPQPATETKSAPATPVNPAPSAETPPPATANQPSAETPAPAAENSPAKANANPESKPESPATVAPHTSEKAVKSAAAAKADRRASTRNSRKAALEKAALPPADDTGEADLRKGEAYLYGQGVRENCDAAIRNLKAASAKLNPRARSTFGTMYATGHCVPRDLPTSYSWFALALRVDPNNQILEKDLMAVWNQMTPPERQLATRLKQ